jgi:hypothetical protein
MGDVVGHGLVQTFVTTGAEQLNGWRVIIHTQEDSLIRLGFRNAVETTAFDTVTICLVNHFRGKVYF